VQKQQEAKEEAAEESMHASTPQRFGLLAGIDDGFTTWESEGEIQVLAKRGPCPSARRWCCEARSKRPQQQKNVESNRVEDWHLCVNLYHNSTSSSRVPARDRLAFEGRLDDIFTASTFGDAGRCLTASHAAGGPVARNASATSESSSSVAPT